MASLEAGAFDRPPMGQTQKKLGEDVYRKAVLRPSPDLTEDEIDRRLEAEACLLGVQNESPPVDRLMTSDSATTIASDPQKPGSAISQSTEPTSCSSSEQQTTYQSSGFHSPPGSPTRSVNTPLYFFRDKKASAFRNGFRRMSMFKRRRSGASSDAVAAIGVEKGLGDAGPIERHSKRGNSDSPSSTASRKSSCSTSLLPATKSKTRDLPSDEKEAVRRAMQCVKLQELQSEQRDEKDRFLEYQRKCLSDMRTEHGQSKKQRTNAHAVLVEQAITRNDESVADLESRHLEAEMRLISDLDAEKRACVLRLRHMEAYCHYQSPSHTPPGTPPPTSSDRSSLDSPSRSPHKYVNTDTDTNPNLDCPPYARKVTDKDFHNLAQQYRQRDTMGALHNSKIEVLRGRQEKKYSDLLAKQHREMDELKARQRREMDKEASDARAAEEALKSALSEKRYRLQRRWRLETKIEKAKQEKTTGLHFAMPPDITIVDADNFDLPTTASFNFTA